MRLQKSPLEWPFTGISLRQKGHHQLNHLLSAALKFLFLGHPKVGGLSTGACGTVLLLCCCNNDFVSGAAAPLSAGCGGLGCPTSGAGGLYTWNLSSAVCLYLGGGCLKCRYLRTESQRGVDAFRVSWHSLRVQVYATVALAVSGGGPGPKWKWCEVHQLPG